MAYTRLRTIVEFSDNSDYSEPTAVFDESFTSSTPTRTLAINVSPITGTPAVVDFAPFTTVTFACVKNNDTAAAVVATYTNAAAVAQSVSLAIGEIAILPDLQVAADLTLTTASATAISCDVFIVGT